MALRIEQGCTEGRAVPRAGPCGPRPEALKLEGRTI